MLVLAALVACHDGTIDVADSDTIEHVGPGPDLSGPLFEPDHVVEVEVTLDPADWAALSAQGHEVLDLLGGECLAQPFESPYTYFHAAVTVDGTAFDDVGVRKKALLGSASVEKPGLKVKFDEYEDGAYLGLDKLTLNNSVQDASITHQCLGYEVFAAAGLAAPRCNFAHVVVNGADLGVYVNVESPDDRFLARQFDDPDGTLFEGTLSDFRDGWTGTFAQKTNEETDESARLDAVTDAIDAPDDELLGSLDGVIDLDEYLDFWATEVLIGHWDGYAGNTNNFFVYANPADDGRFTFMPWGIDATFQSRDPFGSFRSVVANAALPRRLYRHPEGRERYVAALRGVVDRAWDEDTLDREADRMELLVLPYIDGDHHAGFVDGQNATRDFIVHRRADLEAELDDPPAWDADLRGPPCLVEVGTVDATFTTTWGTLNVTDPFTTGTAELSVIYDGYPFPFEQFGAVAGIIDPAGEHPGAVALGARINADTFMIPYLQFDPAAVVVGTEMPFEAGAGALLYQSPDTNGQLVQGAYFGPGTLELDAFGDAPDDAVRGRFTASLLGQGG
jgi:hypothetical protein